MFLTLDEVKAVLLILETRGQVRSNAVNSLQEKLVEYQRVMGLHQVNPDIIPIAGQLSFDEIGD